MANRLLHWLAASLFLSAVLIGLAAEFMAREEGRGHVLNLPSIENERLNEDGRPVLKDIREQGRLVVLTRNAPTTYYLERETPAGYEYDLVRAFADHLGVKIEFKVLDTTSGILKAMENGRGHIAAAGLTRSETDGKGFIQGPDYAAVKLQLVCHRRGVRLKDPKDLAETPLMVISDTSYENRLKALSADWPHLEWATVYDFSTEDLMERVARRAIGCTVGDSPVVAINRRYFPELVVPFDLTGADKLVWLLIDGAPSLKEEVDAWFALAQTKDLLRRLDERYYGHVPNYDYVDLRSFRQRITSRLPQYRKPFEAAARKTGLPWTLLAAVAYQESHWVKNARSPTGVRGLMMLTQATAKDMGVKNRLHPEQSIQGGARYLASLRKRLPQSITGEDRLWFVLAAYNVGLGHLLDARELARRQNLNPDRWTDVKTVLPLLSQPAYYNTLTYGYARGAEPVRYVQRVRHYHDILERRFGPAPWDQALMMSGGSAGDETPAEAPSP